MPRRKSSAGSPNITVKQYVKAARGSTVNLSGVSQPPPGPAPTAQQLHSESCALAEAGSFEQAAIKAEAACALAEKDSDTKLQWRTSLDAARDWLNHGFDTLLSEPARENLVARAAKNIAVAENAGAPTGAVALEKALLASQQHDNEGFIRYATLVASDASCGDAYQAEALAMRLQGLLFAERIDEALACVEAVEKLRLSAAGEQLLQIEAAWLRILCAAQLATEDDVTHCIECAEGLTAVHPKLRFRTLNTVIRQFSRAAQEQSKPAAVTLIFERLTICGVKQEFRQMPSAGTQFAQPTPSGFSSPLALAHPSPPAPLTSHSPSGTPTAHPQSAGTPDCWGGRRSKSASTHSCCAS